MYSECLKRYTRAMTVASFQKDLVSQRHQLGTKRSCDADAGILIESGKTGELSASAAINKPANATDADKITVPQIFIPKPAHMQDYFGDIESIGVFATKSNATLEWINCEAKRLRLVKTLTGRYRHRVAFHWLPQPIRPLYARSRPIMFKRP